MVSSSWRYSGSICIFTSQGLVISFLLFVEVRYHNTLTCEVGLNVAIKIHFDIGFNFYHVRRWICLILNSSCKLNCSSALPNPKFFMTGELQFRIIFNDFTDKIVSIGRCCSVLIRSSMLVGSKLYGNLIC